MKLKNLKEIKDEDSKKVSEITRNLGIVGIGVIWIFKIEVGSVVSVPWELLPPAFFLVLGLSLDLLHAVVRYLIYSIFYFIKEKECSQDKGKEFTLPEWFRRVITFFFLGKVAAIVWAYVLLMQFVGNRFSG
ncbi:MAG TPA: hypothetical protein PLT76_08735 [Candidatus Omnitrophota bacterium]|nr:hypothetical protein [Candidatus Omnitrophota bacterium]HPB67921.1 hypothetical protein [Candidatus Omnitrophota bacterium]HQO58788.1 hypothetical protein [Candidatus Omnitrophota bacterium]